MLFRDQHLEELLVRAVPLPDQAERPCLSREFERIWIGEQDAVVPIAYGDAELWRARGSLGADLDRDLDVCRRGRHAA